MADGIITAAGLSSRMHDLKALLPIENRAAIVRIADQLLKGGTDRLIVVTGHREDEIRSALAGYPVVFVRNRNYATNQMLDSVQIALSVRWGQPDTPCFMTPVDVPLFREDTVSTLLSKVQSGKSRFNSMLNSMQSNEDQPGDYVLPTCNGHTGHPIVFSPCAAAEIQAYNGEGGLKGCIKQTNLRVNRIQVDDIGMLYDMDTPEDYRRICEVTAEIPSADYMGSVDCTISSDNHKETADDYPDGALCAKLLDEMPDAVWEHSLAVQKMAIELAMRAEKRGINLDFRLIGTAALLHDIRRTEPNHAQVGAAYLRSMGYDAVADVVACHHDLNAEVLNEAAIVYLADKCVSGDKRVSVRERFEKSRHKCTTPEAIAAHDRRCRQAMNIVELFEEACGPL